MALPLTDLQIRQQVEAKDDKTERLLLMIYHELRSLSLQLYALDRRRDSEKFAELADDDALMHYRPDDRHFFS